MKSVLVIGMGRYGTTVAKKMQQLGNDVMIVDESETIIDQLSANFTDSYIGDCTNEAVIKAIGVDSFDICFVATGENFQSSLVVTMLLKRHGAKYVVSKANQEIQSEILREIGADEVVNPEKEMAERIAIRHSANNVFEYIPLSKEFSLYEIGLPESWANHSILELNVRAKYNINIIAIKSAGEILSMPTPDYRFNVNDKIYIISTPKALSRIK